MADPQGARGAIAPLDWGQKKFLTPPKNKKKFIARPKNTGICKPPFACQNVLKLTYSNLEFQNFPGEDPRTPLSKGRGGKGKGEEERAGKGKGRREGKDREGRGGEGREGTWEGRNGGGEGSSTWAPPP